jgi:hypothetical protein
MTDLQWSTICTIRQEPEYHFHGDERKVAERMVDRGWLKRLCLRKIHTGAYLITALGLKVFRQSWI